VLRKGFCLCLVASDVEFGAVRRESDFHLAETGPRGEKAAAGKNRIVSREETCPSVFKTTPTNGARPWRSSIGECAQPMRRFNSPRPRLRCGCRSQEIGEPTRKSS